MARHSSKPPPEPAKLTEVPARERRKVLARAVGGVLVMDLGLLLAYALIPFQDFTGLGPSTIFLGIIAVFVAVVVWQLRAISRSRFPGVRAAAATAFAIPTYWLLWSLAYLALSQTTPDSFTEPMNRVDALYFTVTVFATVGFGDISAQSSLARVAVTGQMILNLLVIGVVVKLLLGTAQRRFTQGRPAERG